MYSSLASILSEWSDYEFSQVKTVNEYMSTFFKFRYTKIPALTNIFKERESCYTPYQKAENKLNT
jgi:hypothetical protein